MTWTAALEVLEVFRVALREEALLCVLIGASVLARRRALLLLCLAALVAAWCAGATLQVAQNGYLSTRHMLVPALILLPLGGAGLRALWQAGRPGGAARRSSRALAVLLVASMAASGARTRHTDHGPRLQALAWVVEHDPGGGRIGVHRRKDGWYARRPVLLVELPCRDEDLLRIADETGTRLLVLDLPEVAACAPHWLDGPDWIERARFGAGDEAVVVLERRAPG